VLAVNASGPLRNQWMTLVTVTDPAGGQPLRVATFTDISAMAQQRTVLKHQALHDALTGLPNRRLFTQGLARSLARAARHAYPLALLRPPETRGARRGPGCAPGRRRIRPGARERVAGRRCGEHRRHPAGRRGERSDDRRDPAQATASIGIAMFPDDAASAEMLERSADAATHLAKMRGRARFALIERIWSPVEGIGEASATLTPTVPCTRPHMVEAACPAE